MSTPQTFKQIADTLQAQLESLLVETVQPTVQAAIKQVPVILEREDMTMEDKRAAIQLLQQAITAPLVSALTGTALGMSMREAEIHYHVADACEQVRNQRMTQIAKEMIGTTDNENSSN